MSTTTPKFGFLKPAGSETVDEVLHLNNNWDIADGSLEKSVVKRRTTNSSARSSTTSTIDDVLQGVTLKSGITYRFKAVLFFKTDLGGQFDTNPVIQFKTTSNFNRAWIGVLGQDQASNSEDVNMKGGYFSNTNSLSFWTRGGQSDVTKLVLVHGFILPNEEDFAVDLYWAPEDTQDDVVLRKDSYMKFSR